MGRRLHSTWVLTLLLGFGLGLAPDGAARAQDWPPPAPGSHIRNLKPHPWSSLTPPQRELLSPLRADWDAMPPPKQAHMLGKAAHWLTLPADQRAKIRDRIARWHAMTPEQRAQARENMRKFHNLPPDQRERLHEAFRQFQQLPPDERERLLHQWRAQPMEQRDRWMRPPHPAGGPLPGAQAHHRPDFGSADGPPPNDDSNGF